MYKIIGFSKERFELNKFYLSNPTMFGIPYVKAMHLGDEYANDIIQHIKNVDIYQKQCDNLYDNLYTEAILTRHEFIKFVLEKEENNYDQLLVLSTGLDTKTDNLKCLYNKNCYGLDILANEINYVKNRVSALHNIEIIYCDFNNIEKTPLLDTLVGKGFSLNKNTFLLWEGGTYYLNQKTVKETLNYFISNINIIGYAIDFVGHDTINLKQNFSGQKLLEYFKDINQPWHSFYKLKDIKHLNTLFFNQSNIYNFSDFKHIHCKDSSLEDNIFYYLYGYS